MKRGTPDHPKVLMLANRLGLKKYAAVGLLETLWHFTARYAPRGDIGRFSDGIIATSLDWGGNVPDLIEALVQEHWLDQSNEYRLVVHHWSDHADDTCDKYLANHGMIYADGKEPRRSPEKGVKVKSLAEKSGKVGKSREKLALSEPEPESESKPESVPLPVGEPTATTEDSGKVGKSPEPATTGMLEQVQRIKGIRKEFEVLRDVDIENALKGCPEEHRESALGDFERDMVAALAIPDMPVKVLRSYLAVAAKKNNPGAVGAGEPMSRRFITEKEKKTNGKATAIQ